MRALAVCAAAVVAVVTAATVAADPQDLVPYCSGDQTPMDSNCRAPSSQVFTHPDPTGSGLSPDLPYGLTPGQEPAV